MPLLPEIPRPTEPRRGFTRRQVLRWGVAGSVAVLVPVSLPGCGDDGEPVGGKEAASASFLDQQERRTLHALIDTLFPAEDGPGSLAVGADRYIEKLLSELPSESDPGAVFAGGPYSGRHPFPDYERGVPSNRFPPNDFQTFVPLNRLQRISWRARILGSTAVPEFDFNAQVLGPLVGLRTQYRQGLRELVDTSQAQFAKDFADLSTAERQQIVQQADSDFISLVTGHIFEAMFSAPEYGGNKDGVGWKSIGYDGDSQPLGYALFHRPSQTYRERPDKPLSGPNPDEAFAPFPPEIATLLRTLTRLAGNPRFP